MQVRLNLLGTKASVYDPITIQFVWQIPAAHQHYHHNEENMSKACLHNYKTNMRLPLKGYNLKTTPEAIYNPCIILEPTFISRLVK
ncbi:hypothetical protein QL285_069183 [Trifolium repens]|nr:hypothetical protein QL285_069183 [Trifolium repens]